MFEMKILKITHLIFLTSFIWKWFVVKILIYYILMVIALKETYLRYDNYQTLYMTHNCLNFNEFVAISSTWCCDSS